MRRELPAAGLILFPPAGLFCLTGMVVVQAFKEGTDRPFEEALRYARSYGACGLLSAAGFVACLAAMVAFGGGRG